MKKSIKKLIFSVFVCTLGLMSVNAKEITNANGTFDLTDKEYQYAKEFYGDNYFKRMNKENYKWLKELDIEHNDVKIKKSVVPDVAHPNDSYVASSTKSLAISRACANDYCLVTVYADWLANPVTKSYDVIGVRFDGASLYSSSVHTVTGGTNSYQTFSNYRNFSNGFGNSVVLPNDTNLFVEQTFYTKRGGTVYASYQHAMHNVSLEVSKQYSISLGGYGKVLLFSGDAYGVYDAFPGVDITL